jgi:hypothetical protein
MTGKIEIGADGRAKWKSNPDDFGAEKLHPERTTNLRKPLGRDSAQALGEAIERVIPGRLERNDRDGTARASSGLVRIGKELRSKDGFGTRFLDAGSGQNGFDAGEAPPPGVRRFLTQDGAGIAGSDCVAAGMILIELADGSVLSVVAENGADGSPPLIRISEA